MKPNHQTKDGEKLDCSLHKLPIPCSLCEAIRRIKEIDRELENHRGNIMILESEKSRLFLQLEPVVVKQPKWSRVDVKAPCKVCSHPTTWRHPKGWAQHPENSCHIPISRLGTTPLPRELWEKLDEILSEGEVEEEVDSKGTLNDSL